MMRAMFKAMLVLALAAPLSVHAALTPHEVVEDTSVRVMEVLDANRETYKQDTEAFLNGLNEIMNPVVDFRGIARSVMTVRYSGRASEEQMDRFIETFKRSMVQFYGNALLEFDSGTITVLPPTGRGTYGDDRTSVDMEVRTSSGMVYPVTYTMVRIDDQWKVRNVIVEGINMGLLFRDQFAQAMQTHRGDLDALIANWGSVVAESAKTVEKEAKN
ncbi:ABC transporter substrate-binding protein [uncultured Halopseudomonas sp.]|uniref:MlaC/ttg2D family ABC transporter substrate-binding protein n=1 Tax=uncultured Halopseudomonas sp. TaxID=2901193 RepID=UPI0030EB7A6A